MFYFFFSCESQTMDLKQQVLFSLKNNEKYLWMSAAAVVIGAFRVKRQNLIFSFSQTEWKNVLE